MAYLKFNPALIKAQPGSMSHTTEFQGKLQRWTESSYPDVDFPREFILREGLLREKVTLFQRDGSVKGEVSRFVLCAPPPKPEVPVATVEEVEEFERAEMLAGIESEVRVDRSEREQPVRDVREQNVRDWRDLIEPKAQNDLASVLNPTSTDPDDDMPRAPAPRRGGRSPAASKPSDS